MGPFLISTVLFFVTCYWLGGQTGVGKWVRRFLGPGVLAASIILSLFINPPFSWLAAFGAVLYLGAANGVSYGSQWTNNNTLFKIIFRGLCGASYGLCAIFIGSGLGNLNLGFAQAMLAICGSIFFGVVNPFPSKWGNWATISEDICISTSYVCLIPFII